MSRTTIHQGLAELDGHELAAERCRRSGGREFQPKGHPEEVRVHDFLDKKLGKAIPYGVYDVAKNLGWGNVGCDHDTAAFAVAGIQRWWRAMGKARLDTRLYPDKIKVSDEQLNSVNLNKHHFHGEWNYTIKPS